MRLVDAEDELEGAFTTAAAEARGGVRRRQPLRREGDRRPARHVEIQVLCRRAGRRADARRARVLDPAPPPEADRGVAVARSRRRRARRWRAPPSVPCRRSATATPGTFEFLLGPDRQLLLHRAERAPAGRASGHGARRPGIDLVREQLRIAAGERLAATGRAPRRGHAIEIRINAEDPARDFAPAPGRITSFRPPLGPGIRLDTFVEAGSPVPPFYDSLLGKLAVWDEDRPAAISRTLRALGELSVGGIPTTRELAIQILRSEQFASGHYSTSFLEESGQWPRRGGDGMSVARLRLRSRGETLFPHEPPSP